MLEIEPFDASVTDEKDSDVDATDATLGETGSGLACKGSATPCSLLGPSQCATSLGCYEDGECAGSATSCYSLFTMTSCMSQQGCYWSSTNDSCSGSAWSCTMFSGQYSCTDQQWCHWSDGCAGVPLPCEYFGPAECMAQPGCFLGER